MSDAGKIGETVTIHEPFLWWLGLASLMRDQVNRDFRDVLLSQLADYRQEPDDVARINRMGVTMRAVTWRRMISTWKHAESKVLRRASMLLAEAYDEARKGD